MEPPSKRLNPLSGVGGFSPTSIGPRVSSSWRTFQPPERGGRVLALALYDFVRRAAALSQPPERGGRVLAYKVTHGGGIHAEESQPPERGGRVLALGVRSILAGRMREGVSTP